MADDRRARLFQLPEQVQDYVFGEQAGELNRTIITKNALPEEDLGLLFDAINDAILGDIRIENLVPELQKRLSLEPDAAKRLAVDVAGYRLLPLDKFLGDVSGYILNLGGDPTAYPPMRIKIEERTVDEASEEIATSMGANSFEHRMKERLKDITESFLNGVRTEAQIVDVLKKSIKTGGMDFDDATARRVLEGMKEELRSVHLVEDKMPAKAPASAADGETTPPAPAAKKTDDFVTVKPEDEKEIAEIKATAMRDKIAPVSADTAAKIAASIDELYAKSGFAPQDEDLQKRLKTVIGNRLRDVRDSLETLETLVQPKELGGLGMTSDGARNLIGLIEAKLKEVHALHAQETAAKKTEWVNAEEQKKTEKEASLQIKETKELEDLFRTVVAKSPKAAAKAAAMPSLPMPPMPAVAAAPPAPAKPAAPPPPAMKPAMPEPPPAVGKPPANLPFVEPPAAPIPPPPTAIQPPRPTVVRPPAPPPAPAMKPAMPTTIVRPVMPAPMSLKPKMEDIRAASPRLTGPVEELRATSLVDFRRLSKDPKEACMKIKDKVDLLADQSYDKRTEGIKAWGESEVNRTYVDQMREALDGKPMPNVISDRQAAKQPYLSPEETAAVADLNRQLRY